MSTASALSMATSVPAPMAMPRSACASAGASLMPSPIIATRWPAACSALMCSALFSGSTPAMTFSMPMRRRMASAVCALSPVSMHDIDAHLVEARDGLAARRLLHIGGSEDADDAVSCAKISGVQPSSEKAASWAS